MDLMEGVEEIPGVVLAEGLTWEWESLIPTICANVSLLRTSSW